MDIFAHSFTYYNILLSVPWTTNNLCVADGIDYSQELATVGRHGKNRSRPRKFQVWREDRMSTHELILLIFKILLHQCWVAQLCCGTLLGIIFTESIHSLKISCIRWTFLSPLTKIIWTGTSFPRSICLKTINLVNSMMRRNWLDSVLCHSGRSLALWPTGCKLQKTLVMVELWVFWKKLSVKQEIKSKTHVYPPPSLFGGNFLRIKRTSAEGRISTKK